MTFGGAFFLLVLAGLVVAIIVRYNKLVGLRQRSDEAGRTSTSSFTAAPIWCPT